DLMPLRDEKLKMIFGGVNRPETQPIYHVAPGAPPALLMTGGRDRLVEPGNSVRLAARLVAAGNAATVLTYRRIGHFIIIAALAPFHLRARRGPFLAFPGPVIAGWERFHRRQMAWAAAQGVGPDEVF